MASLFCTPDSYDKTKVLSLDNGETYFAVNITPVVGDKELNNSKLHEKGINAIVSNFNIESNTRTQFVSTLGIDVYAYTFGENLDQITISGMGFIPCGGSANGFNELIEFWSDNNIGRHGLFCKIVINGISYKAYLTDAEIGATERLLGIFAFKFIFQAVKA